MPEAKEMTKGEREELKRLARERARVAKADAAARTADLKASFEEHVSAHYMWDQDDVWEKAALAAKDACVEANATIKERCIELGIPANFAPEIVFHWAQRSPRWEVKATQDELRRTAYKRIEAMERTAKHEIDRACLTIQTQLVRAGLTSEAALEFLEGMPSVEGLMPALDIRELSRGQLPPGEDGIEF